MNLILNSCEILNYIRQLERVMIFRKARKKGGKNCQNRFNDIKPSKKNVMLYINI